MKRRCCFLSMDDLAGYVSDDELAIEPLNDLGWDVETVSWRDETADWNDFEAVIIRTPWDYQEDPEKFLEVLRRIDSSSARLENALSIVEWNLDKKYLKELEDRGVRIVPTVWSDAVVSAEGFSEWKRELTADELIIKPTISATAKDTFRRVEFDDALSDVFSGRNYMVQPFMPQIVEEGEYSLFYFNGVYSHTILKAPKAGDFRVQEEHGGLISAIEPEAKMLETAKQINDLIEPLPLYSRIDLVRCDDGAFALMELELIEPALYFRMDERSPRLFAREFDRRMNEL